MLWGKSKAGPDGDCRVNLLLQHLLDTAAVGELIWDRFLAPGVRARIDGSCDGHGRVLFTLLCGLHDVGKASPAFQSKVPELAERVRAAGLTWGHLDARDRRWHHTLAGAIIVRRVLEQAGWDKRAQRWTWPLVAGHHGVVPAMGKLGLPSSRGDAQGAGTGWLAAQEALVAAVAGALGVDLAAVVPSGCPRRAGQLAVSGAIIMADWIASGVQFPGVDDLSEVSMAGARDRALRAWKQLDLRGGWRAAPYAPVPDLVAERFGQAARPVQASAVSLAERMAGPGLMMIEAPMGEGKTEAALAAAEVLARRFGADGVFVGMPTQATCDPMFARVFDWAQRVEAQTPVGLLHGKARFNRKWHALNQTVRFTGIDERGAGGPDEFGCDDDYGMGGMVCRRAPEAPAEWFLGSKRGLLMPVTVGTVDQLLHAATRTRHVMLRHVGLAGRVVILDEVHAYDVYMAQFLFEALRWLADGGVPVILLSATLPPSLRDELARAYLQGATLRRDIQQPPAGPEDAYPVVRSLCIRDGEPSADQLEAEPWRASVQVAVEVLGEGPDDGPGAVVSLLADALADGGCALVVRNTVGRAQQTFRAAKAAFGADEAVLLHARLTVGERADRTARVLGLLGPAGRDGARARPRRLIVVATQLAEQSFDVDVDLLVTDLAPIDLLLQRAGRLHRHARADDARPWRVRAPRLVVTGMRVQPLAAPAFPQGSVYVYGQHLLLRSAALVNDAAAGAGWSIPADVPALVRLGYGDQALGPDARQPDMQAARLKWSGKQRDRRDNAAKFLLAGEDALGASHLAGLHDIQTHDLYDDDAVAAVVRDGPEAVEVILVRADDGSGHRTLSGQSIGVAGAAIHDPEVAEAVMRSAVRLPPRDSVTRAARNELMPLPECGDDPWLRRTKALVLDDHGAALLGGRRLAYDPELGLIDEPA